MLLLIPSLCLAQRPPDLDPELTLAEYRALLPDPSAEQDAEATDYRATEAFFALLAAQGREAAARQSLDRLAGWTRAAETRLAAQSAPLLEVEMLRFAEARAEARLARLEAERRRALAAANRLLGRAPDSPLLAVTTETDSPAAPSANLPAVASAKAADFASQVARFEQELLPQAHDLLAKTYQSYLFGGVPLSTLLWQEEQVRETELQYRSLLVEAERARATGE